MNVQVILGSTRPERFSEKVGKWVFEQISNNSEIEAELVDLRDYPLPFFDEPVSPAMFKMMKKDYSNEVAKKWAQKVAEADAYIIVTPEYNHGYSAVLKNALDYAYSQWNNKPITFVAYGGMVGGARSVEQLRQVAIELQMAPIREALYFPKFWEAFDENGQPKDSKANENLNNVLIQLIWWAKALKEARGKS